MSQTDVPTPASGGSDAPAFPTGEQWTLRQGDQEVVVVEVGGGLRSYTRGGADLLHGFAQDEECHSGRGQLLMPWPNRVRDGKFTYDGQAYQLALTEPPRHNATHGLVRWAIWSVQDRSEAAITLACKLRPQQGWAWSLDLSVTYALDADGLTVTPTATNVGPTAAPFGFGVHPYLTAGESSVDELELTLPVTTRLDVDPERLLPVGSRTPVDGTELDFRTSKVIGSTQLDTAFTGVVADDDGRWRVVLTAPSTGRTTTLWADAAAYPWMQVFSGDALPAAQRRSSGVAVEPMTCPPDALNSGEDLITLSPGERFSASWGIG